MPYLSEKKRTIERGMFLFCNSDEHFDGCTSKETDRSSQEKEALWTKKLLVK
jgi:hypothetical protein